MSHTAYQRARRAFWASVAVAVVLAGALGGVLREPPGPAAGIGFAVLATLLTGVVALATRLLLALTGRLSTPDRSSTGPRRRRR
jgi:hypothetical protein